MNQTLDQLCAILKELSERVDNLESLLGEALLDLEERLDDHNGRISLLED